MRREVHTHARGKVRRIGEERKGIDIERKGKGEGRQGKKGGKGRVAWNCCKKKGMEQ